MCLEGNDELAINLPAKVLIHCNVAALRNHESIFIKNVRKDISIGNSIFCRELLKVFWHSAAWLGFVVSVFPYGNRKAGVWDKYDTPERFAVRPTSFFGGCRLPEEMGQPAGESLSREVWMEYVA